jgi:hypothetical protein
MLNDDIKMKTSDTYSCVIYIASNYDDARRSLQNMAAGKGMCVSIEKCGFVYTGGYEEGVAIRLINYPRFPSEKSDIKDQAVKIAEAVMLETGQGSCTIECLDETVFLSRRNGD